MESIAHTWLWVAFSVVVAVALALDLGVFNRKAHEIKLREAALSTMGWVLLALAFNLMLGLLYGSKPALEFFTGYIIEYSLSVDNLFVFLVIFSYFQVDGKNRHRVLFWGILGAVVMRAVFVLVGAALLHRFHWLVYLFGAFLVFTGVKLVFSRTDENIDPERNIILRITKRLLPMAREYHGEHFLVHIDGRSLATPLLMVLVFLETSDIVFALDSIPAILAITTDPFIVLSSNILAVCGLRSLFFLLAGLISGFRFLHYGLAGVLSFVGVKMLVSEFFKVPIMASLLAIALMLGLSIAASLMWPPPKTTSGE